MCMDGSITDVKSSMLGRDWSVQQHYELLVGSLKLFFSGPCFHRYKISPQKSPIFNIFVVVLVCDHHGTSWLMLTGPVLLTYGRGRYRESESSEGLLSQCEASTNHRRQLQPQQREKRQQQVTPLTKLVRAFFFYQNVVAIPKLSLPNGPNYE